ncbi:MAG TPA: hypothetical protein VHH73_16825 [Verrucomicrobiae bacterium]|nr:hypothetical protein [Verrucomicrobiae bacterium]
MARSLKGRVSCGELLAEDGWRELPLVTATLGSPKPTFYPNYIRQPIGDAGSGRIAGDYATFMDDDAEISGWKRYPAHPEGNGAFAAKVSTGGTDDTVTRFRPLDQGAVFRGKVRVHNLRPAEVGALLWALSFGGREELRHRLGMAKPLGYGSVTVRLTGHRLRSVADGKEPDVRQCTEAFVGLMTTNVPRWEQSPQLRELLAMGDPHLAHDGRRLDYPRLEMHGPNEFREKKRSRLALVSYSGELPAESGPLPLPPVAPPPPRLLPDLTGQKRQVSFQRSKDNRALGHELWFRVKEGNEKFDAVLRNPKLPKHCGQLRNGDSFPLWVRGIEGDHYLLGETEVDSED